MKVANAVWGVLITLVGVLAIGLSIAVYMVGFAGPDLRVRDLRGSKWVDVQFLGEYCSSITRFELRDMTTDQVVWAAVPTAGKMAVWTFLLGLGTNSVQVGLNEPLRVLTPEVGDAFVTVPGHSYRLTVWGQNGWGGSGKSSVKFEWASVVPIPRPDSGGQARRALTTG